MEISEDGADPVHLDRLGRRLLRDLRALGLDAEHAAAPAPAGAKSGSSAVVTSLLVALVGAPSVAALVNGVFGWLGPRRGTVKISCGDRSIELSAATPAEGRRLFEWLQECDPQGPAPERPERDD